MTKLRNVAFGIAVALAFAAAPAQAQDAGAWNTQYGLIFSVQNVFQNDSDAVIGDFGGGVGLQYNLDSSRALRLSVNLARASQAAYATESTNLVTGVTTESFVAPSFTSRYDVDLGALYVMRLAPSAIAPYLGFGGGIGFIEQLLVEAEVAGVQAIDLQHVGAFQLVQQVGRGVHPGSGQMS